MSGQAMRVLLVRPVSPNERFGLGPFFRVEPLGLEYVARALQDRGHEVRIADLRFGPSLGRRLASFRPQLVGIACTHTVDVPGALGVAREVRRRAPELKILVGGHAASTCPEPCLIPEVDALCVGDGEVTVAEYADAIAGGRSPRELGGLWLRQDARPGAAGFLPPRPSERVSLDQVPLPARELLTAEQRGYLCVHKIPLWAVETARGCPYRCSFCSIWKQHGRSLRLRDTGQVILDLDRVGHNVFVVDDLFFQPTSRSRELARELRRRGVKKDWMLVQARLDTVAKHADLLAEWRPVARQFDLFFGFEAPTDQGLESLNKQMNVGALETGVRVAKEYGYGVTGNFVVDPDWGESDFVALWELVDRLGLERSGYTVLTPLPGTPWFEEVRRRIQEWDWSRYDMHHLLWEPRLGRRRFFELFARSWQKNVLNPVRSRKKWRSWMRGLTLGQALQLIQIIYRTRRLLAVDAYLAETFPLGLPMGVAGGPILPGCPLQPSSEPSSGPCRGDSPGYRARRGRA
jgi:radical SAM superfamily enzyme YgiQ (UPF0313 family)